MTSNIFVHSSERTRLEEQEQDKGGKEHKKSADQVENMKHDGEHSQRNPCCTEFVVFYP